MVYLLIWLFFYFICIKKMYTFFFKYMFFGVENKNLKSIFGGRI